MKSNRIRVPPMRSMPLFDKLADSLSEFGNVVVDDDGWITLETVNDRHLEKFHALVAELVGIDNIVEYDRIEEQDFQVERKEFKMIQGLKWTEYGYLGHERRTPETDKALAEAADKLSVDPGLVMLWANSSYGRHRMDEGELDFEYFLKSDLQWIVNEVIRDGIWK